MRRAIIAVVLSLVLGGATCHGLRVIDGDTFEVTSTGERLRLNKWDTPELGDRYFSCQHGKARKARTRAGQLLCAAGHVRVQRSHYDKYRRTISNIYVDGTDIGELLAKEGLARRYRPGKTGKGWCK